MDEDGDLEVSRPVDRVARMREIENMGIDRETFENIEREFQDFLQSIIGETSLERFREQYEQTYELLKSSYRTEQDLIKKCLDFIKKAQESSIDLNNAVRLAALEMEKIDGLRNKVDKAYNELSRMKVKEEESRQEIQSLKVDIANLKRQQGLATELEEDKQLKELKNEFDNLLKVTNDQTDHIFGLQYRNNELEEEKKRCEDEIDQMENDREMCRKNIGEITEKVEELKKQRNILEEAKKDIKNSKKDKRAELEAKQKELEEAKNALRIAEQSKQDTEDKIADLEESHRAEKNAVATKDDENKNIQRDLTKAQANLDKLIVDKDREEDLLKDLYEDIKKLQKEHDFRFKQNQGISRKRDQAKLDEEFKKERATSAERKLEKVKSVVGEKKKEIEDKLRERDLLNKDVVDKQNISREMEGEKKNLENELKKLRNKVEGYKTETQKLRDMINQLEKDKDKYGTEASQANAKYYQCMEKVKMKSTLITKLQKKNAEAEAKLKQQQNLYEAVRSDRNLYSKNLLEAQDEISELKMKFRRMTYKISQLKDEIATKDAEIQKERGALQKHNKENQDLESEIKKKEGYIKSLDQMIKTQEADIGRLKYVITEAEAEKQKQRKDYEMVINERDILGTQLIKRQEELQLLYEKIKIQQSTLKKGEIYYQKRYEDIEQLKAQIADVKKQIIVHQNETACIVDLKKEIYLLQKELLELQQKEKILTQELEKPMNVHRWRKLE